MDMLVHSMKQKYIVLIASKQIDKYLGGQLELLTSIYTEQKRNFTLLFVKNIFYNITAMAIIFISN